METRHVRDDLTEHEMAIIENWMRDSGLFLIGRPRDYDCLSKPGSFFGYCRIPYEYLTTRITAQQAMEQIT